MLNRTNKKSQGRGPLAFADYILTLQESTGIAASNIPEYQEADAVSIIALRSCIFSMIRVFSSPSAGVG